MKFSGFWDVTPWSLAERRAGCIIRARGYCSLNHRSIIIHHANRDSRIL
jgi:hypothetical protein